MALGRNRRTEEPDDHREVGSGDHPAEQDRKINEPDRGDAARVDGTAEHDPGEIPSLVDAMGPADGTEAASPSLFERVKLGASVLGSATRLVWVVAELIIHHL